MYPESNQQKHTYTLTVFVYFTFMTTHTNKRNNCFYAEARTSFLSIVMIHFMLFNIF